MSEHQDSKLDSVKQTAQKAADATVEVASRVGSVLQEAGSFLVAKTTEGASRAASETKQFAGRVFGEHQQVATQFLKGMVTDGFGSGSELLSPVFVWENEGQRLNREEWLSFAAKYEALGWKPSDVPSAVTRLDFYTGSRKGEYMFQMTAEWGPFKGKWFSGEDISGKTVKDFRIMGDICVDDAGLISKVNQRSDDMRKALGLSPGEPSFAKK